MDRWQQSVADYRQLSRLRPDDSLAAFSLGLAYLGAGDAASYRELSRRMIEQFGDTRDASTANDVAQLAVTLPDVPDTERIVQLAQFAHDSKPDSADYLETLGAALCRAGRYPEAVDRLKAMREKTGGNGTVGTCFFLAMCHHRLEQYLSGVRTAGLLAGPVDGFGSVRAWGRCFSRTGRQENGSMRESSK